MLVSFQQDTNLEGECTEKSAKKEKTFPRT